MHLFAECVRIIPLFLAEVRTVLSVREKDFSRFVTQWRLRAEEEVQRSREEVMETEMVFGENSYFVAKRRAKEAGMPIEAFRRGDDIAEEEGGVAALAEAMEI
jgi:hypothetical protein